MATAKRKRYGAEEIIGKLREAEVGLAQGQSVAQVVRKLGVSEQTYYRWRREYGEMKVDQAKRLKELERENAELKKIVADQALDKRCSGSSPGETSEPGEAPPGGLIPAGPVRRVRATRLSRRRPGALDRTLRAPRVVG